jgi:hypothetical protein
VRLDDPRAAWLMLRVPEPEPEPLDASTVAQFGHGQPGSSQPGRDEAA